MLKITEQNIKQIYGILKKFFMSDNHGYIDYHNFDCGKRKIKPYENMIPSYYEKPINFELVTEGFDKKFIRMNAEKGCGWTFKVGDYIELKSGKVIHKQKWITDTVEFVYTVFQACKPTEKQLDELHARRIYRDLCFDNYDDIY